MIVNQADYLRWQQMYGNEKSGEPNRVASGEALAAAGAQEQRQAIAAIADEADSKESSEENAREQDFIQQAYEKLLANRLGLDHEKIEELKEEIDKTEKEIEGLEKQQPLSESQRKRLDALNDKLEQLTKALEELIRQGSERTSERELAQSTQKQIAGEYQLMTDLFK